MSKASLPHRAQKQSPWVDTTKPLSVRFIYLGSQKVVKGVLPLKTVIPAEDWLLAVENPG